MFEISLCDPSKECLIGFNYVQGVSEDINEGELTELAIVEFGLLFIKISYIIL